jgi:hypothetical protein
MLPLPLTSLICISHIKLEQWKNIQFKTNIRTNITHRSDGMSTTAFLVLDNLFRVHFRNWKM